METTLFVKVALLTAGSLGFAAVGAWVVRAIQSMWAQIGLLIAYIVGAFVLIFTADSLPPAVAVTMLAGWTFLTGLVISKVIERYAQRIGWQPVAYGCMLTAAVMVICGLIGLLSGIDFSWMGNILLIALIGLIIFGIISIFKRMSRTVRMGHAAFGMVVFTGYFIYDWFMVSQMENTWGNAIRISMNLFLDAINWLLYFLQLYAAYVDK